VVNSPGTGNTLAIVGFDDGVAKFTVSISFGAEPAFLDLQWDDVDALQITRSADAYIDSMTVAVPSV
jgi:hypothetical protein